MINNHFVEIFLSITLCIIPILGITIGAAIVGARIRQRGLVQIIENYRRTVPPKDDGHAKKTTGQILALISLLSILAIFSLMLLAFFLKNGSFLLVALGFGITAGVCGSIQYSRALKGKR